MSNAHLALENVSVSFDGFKALNDLNLRLEKGELRAVIGPNGAGKSTMMDVITGKTRPDEGSVTFKEDVDLTKFDETNIARLGIGRKFQSPTVIAPLTIYENLLLSVKGEQKLFGGLFNRASARQMEQVEKTLKLIRLEDRRDEQASQLSHGQKQWLEIGMLLMQEPEILLVDEPAAGMTDHETELTADLLTSLAGEHTVMVVEHDMGFIESLKCPVTVLHEGHVLAEGPMDQVQNDPKVIEVYLGR